MRCDGGAFDGSPLVGRERPGTEQLSGRGLWVANQLCDLVQIRTLPTGDRPEPLLGTVKLDLHGLSRDRGDEPPVRDEGTVPDLVDVDAVAPRCPRRLDGQLAFEPRARRGDGGHGTADLRFGGSGQPSMADR
ncbi:MAG TPA: hypothetical protein VLV81_09740 [Acidimicrobiia bacterium]|nr:hypothetical protein [Acidimicrobiia bacterium]